MHLSRYCKIYLWSDDPSSLLIFSTKKASIIRIHRALIDDISSGRLSEAETASLISLGFLVKSAEEEKREMLGYIEELNAINDKLSISLVMNLDCNLACAYCFEGRRKGKHYMNKETADRLLDFIGNKGLADRRRLRLVFYGGEPLLSLELVEYISASLKMKAEEAGISYSAAVVTNGTLLTHSVVSRLKAVGIGRAAVTIDGPREVHDSLRPLKTGGGSFDLIINNLKNVSRMIDLQIGGNYIRENFRSYPLLLDFMLDNGLTPNRINDVRFDFVMQEREDMALPDFHHGCETINQPWLFEAGMFLREETLKRGYRTGRITPAACSLEYKQSLVVNYDGSLYKCTGFLGRDDCKVGDIETGISDYRISHNLDNWKNEECLACEYLPLCFGGCRYMKYVRDGNMDGVDCKKPYLDATLETVVKQDIKYGLVDAHS